MADTKLADLTALTTPSGDDILYVVDDPAGTPLDRKIALDNLFTRGTVTTSAPVINAAQTWNDGAVTFTGLKFNATDTASAAASLLMDLQVGGSTAAAITKNGFVLASGGSVTVPGLSFKNETNTGFAWVGTGDVRVVIAGASSYRFQATTFTLVSDSSRLLIGSNVFLTRRGDANLRFGTADAAAPVAQTLSVQSVVAGTTNTAGANLTITGSQGTGTGAGGSIIFQVAPAGSSGSAQNALVDALTISSTRVVTIAANASSLAQIAMADRGTVLSIYATAFGVQPLALTASGGLRIDNTTGTFSLGTGDTILSRRGAANLRFGAADAAAPVAQTLSVQSVVAGTTNTAGENLTITGSQGTGTGAGGSIIFQVAPAGSTGTAQNALATALTIGSTKLATFADAVRTSAPSGGTAANWKLGTVATVTPTLQNRTIEVDIGGTIYYISAKTTND